MSYTLHMTKHRRPTAKQLGRLAENQPELLNLLVAYFVFEWQDVHPGNPPHGVDQMGVARHIPDYIGMWSDRQAGRCGVGNAINLLRQCPAVRDSKGPGYLEKWMRDCSDL